MKFSPEDYTSLKEAIKDRLHAKGVSLPILKDVYLNEGLSDQRFIWDIFWLSNWCHTHRDNDYLDTHIETATKAAIKELM